MMWVDNESEIIIQIPNLATGRQSRDIIATVKPPYNDTTYLADRIVIPKVSLYLVFIYKMHQKLKLGNDIIYSRFGKGWVCVRNHDRLQKFTESSPV